MQLHSFSYTSVATRAPTRDEMARLLEQARLFNLQQQVTGVLFHAEGGFHQYLEGPAEGIDLVLARIRSSSLHRDIVELVREPIAMREFGDWSMAYRALDGELNHAAFDRLLDERGGSSSPGGLQLRQYWQRVQRSRP